MTDFGRRLGSGDSRRLLIRPYRGAGSAGGAVVAQPWTGGSHGALPRLGAGGTNSDVYDAQLQEALESAESSTRETGSAV